MPAPTPPTAGPSFSRNWGVKGLASCVEDRRSAKGTGAAVCRARCHPTEPHQLQPWQQSSSSTAGHSTCQASHCSPGSSSPHGCAQWGSSYRTCPWPAQGSQHPATGCRHVCAGGSRICPRPGLRCVLRPDSFGRAVQCRAGAMAVVPDRHPRQLQVPPARREQAGLSSVPFLFLYTYSVLPKTEVHVTAREIMSRLLNQYKG